MKRITALVLSMLLILSMSISLTASADSGITVKLNGKALAFDVQPQIINGRTMVPMRTIFEELGATVEWDQETQTVTSARDDVTVKLTIGIPNIRINQQNPIELDTAPCIIDGRTLVPVRAISEAFHMNVEWDGTTQTVLITPPNVNMSAYDKLKEKILLEGELSPGGTCYWIRYAPRNKDYDVCLIYDYENEQLTISYSWEDGDFDESLLISIYPDMNPSLWYNIEFSSGDDYTFFAKYPKAYQPFVVESNDFPEDISIYELLGLSMTLTDLIMEQLVDMSFDDFGLHYVKYQ